jgi:hypothetical protein
VSDPDLPGAVGLTALRVYDWDAADGLCGGSPHVHLCAGTWRPTDPVSGAG